MNYSYWGVEEYEWFDPIVGLVMGGQTLHTDAFEKAMELSERRRVIKEGLYLREVQVESEMPTLFYQQGLWCCIGRQGFSTGDTPSIAYFAWFRGVYRRKKPSGVRVNPLRLVARLAA